VMLAEGKIMEIGVTIAVSLLLLVATVIDCSSGCWEENFFALFERHAAAISTPTRRRIWCAHADGLSPRRGFRPPCVHSFFGGKDRTLFFSGRLVSPRPWH
jgi:hypothetical protein